MRYHTQSSSTPSRTTLAYRARHPLATAASVATVAAFTFLLSACFEPPKSQGASTSSGGAAAPSSGGAAPATMPMDAASAPKQ